MNSVSDAMGLHPRRSVDGIAKPGGKTATELAKLHHERPNGTSWPREDTYNWKRLLSPRNTPAVTGPE